MQVIQLLGSAMGLAFVAGINLYATVLSVGLGLRYGFIELPPELAALSILAHPYVLLAAGIMYTVEFFVDKIPWVDSLWDSFHTFIRPFGAAILGVTAVGDVDPAVEVAVFLLCGGVALSTHLTKAATRLVVNQSPEPFSNIVLSVVEDSLAVIGTWVAITYPALMLTITIAFLVAFVWLAPKIFRLIWVEILALLALLRARLASPDSSDKPTLHDRPSDSYTRHLPEGYFSKKEGGFCVRCASGKGIEPGRNYVGYLCLADDLLFFMTRKLFRTQKYDINLSEVKELVFEKKFVFDRLIFYTGKKTRYLYLFKDKHDRGEKINEILQELCSRKAATISANAGESFMP